MKTESKKPGRVKSALLDWLGIPVSLTSEGFWKEFAAVNDTAGQTVNETTVMSLSAAWACTRLISETVATLPLKIYEKTPDGRRVASEHPLYNILHSRPNARSTATTYWESKVAAMLLRGNSFSEKQYIGSRMVGMRFLIPGRVSGFYDRNGVFKFRYVEESGRESIIAEQNVFHIPGFSLDGRWGLSAISYGAGVFGNALAASSAANSTFEKGLAPTVAFTLDKVLKKEQREDFRESLASVTGSLNAGKSPLLEGGMDAKVIGIKPSDAQLLESRAFSVEEVCRWFRVDPSLVGHGGKDSNWGTGLEQKLLAFLLFTLRPWLTRIEQACNNTLFSPVDQLRYHVEFSIEGLFRADSAGRAAFYSAMVNNGIFTRDEVRMLENMPLMGGNAGVLTVQSAMAPLDLLGGVNTGDSARAALMAWLNKEETHEHSSTVE